MNHRNRSDQPTTVRVTKYGASLTLAFRYSDIYIVSFIISTFALATTGWTGSPERALFDIPHSVQPSENGERRTGE